MLNVNYPEAHGLHFLSAMHGLDGKGEETRKWCTPRLGMDGHLSGTQKVKKYFWCEGKEHEGQGEDISCLIPALRKPNDYESYDLHRFKNT